MLDRLLETGARTKKPGWGGVVSVALHLALIGLAVARTAKANPAVVRDPAPPPITYIDVPAPVDRSPAPGGNTGSRPPADPSLPPLTPPTFTFDVDTPADGASIPVATPAADSGLLDEFSGSGAAGDVTRDFARGTRGVASDATVDTPVRALDGRAPKYPEMLRAAGISGAVRARFVVDSTGRAELATVRILESSHELFTRAVIVSLREARFTPGEVSGRRVRTLVERSFRFDIAGGAR